MRTGLDRLAAEGFARLGGRRTGLLVHPASVDARLRHAVDLAAAAAVDLRALFGPQHGILGQTQDNMIEWEGFTDGRTGVPVHSLYGEHRRPTADMLADLDVLVVDLQDVGARYYTFIWTLMLCMEACAEAGVAMMVLDRPNPLGGLRLEGNVLDPAFRSFVGLAPIPMRHGLTIGELAAFFRRWRNLDLDLEIVDMEGWRRDMDFPATGLPWVMPSPNMPTVDTARVYPGGCLLEGTNLSEGRGTTRPFEILGAPFVDPRALAEAVAAWDLPGCLFRPLHFEPTFQKYAGRLCGGVQVHVTDPRVFEPVVAYTAIVGAAWRLWPGEFAWAAPPYEYETEKLPIDVLCGGDGWRRGIEEGRSPWRMKGEWQGELAAFAELTAEFRRHG